MMLRILNMVASILFIICIPMLLLASNGRGAINTRRLHEYSFDKYDAVTTTGLAKAELMHIADELIVYFSSETELSVADSFNEREAIHLADVKNMIRAAYWIQEGCLLYAIGYIFVGYYLLKRKWWLMLANKLGWACGLTLGILATLGIAIAIDFDAVYIWFHESMFDNNSWLMLPSDLLIRLYPEEFFFDATLYVVIATIIECAIAGGISAAYLIYRKRKSLATVATGGGTGTATV